MKIILIIIISFLYSNARGQLFAEKIYSEHCLHFEDICLAKQIKAENKKFQKTIAEKKIKSIEKKVWSEYDGITEKTITEYSLDGEVLNVKFYDNESLISEEKYHYKSNNLSTYTFSGYIYEGPTMTYVLDTINYEYGAKNNLITKWDNGELTEYLYDSMNHCISEISISNSTTSSIFYKYDGDNLLYVSYHELIDSPPTVEVEFFYDSNNRCIRSFCYDFGGGREYIYDSLGNLIIVKYLNEDLSFSSIESRSYLENKLVKTIFGGEYEIGGGDTLIYNDKGQLIEKNRLGDDESVFKELYQYDLDGNLIDASEYYSGKLGAQKKYKYENGLIQEEEELYEGKISSRVVYKYEYY